MNELETIKKIYGEKFAHYCRQTFPTILEHNGVLLDLLTQKFAPTRSLYDEITSNKLTDEFSCYIFNLFDSLQNQDTFPHSDKSPEELLDEAGYILYPECMTNKEISAFEKYFREDELLCTFSDQRLETCRVWFAVKKNVDEIKRENFPNPKRQDEYGTSVISIQFTRGLGFNLLNITNRYNHSVFNCNATFGNNLDNIIPGLTYAFAKKYDLHLESRFDKEFRLPNYVRPKNGKFYRENINVCGVSFCENNILIDNENVVTLDHSKKILIDQFVFDLEHKRVYAYVDYFFSNDSFVKTIGKIEKISITKDKDRCKIITIKPKTGENVVVVANSNNSMIAYRNPNLKKVDNFFLSHNSTLKVIDLPNVKSIGDNFLFCNKDLTQINIPNVRTIDENFLRVNNKLQTLNCPKLVKVGVGFLASNHALKEAVLPELKQAPSSFMKKASANANLFAPKYNSKKKIKNRHTVIYPTYSELEK